MKRLSRALMAPVLPVLFVVLVPVLACSDRSPSSDAAGGHAAAAGDGVGVTTRANAVTIDLDSSALPPADDCPPDGRWHPCSVEKRLGQSGLAPRRVARDSGVVREEALSVPGTAFTVGRGELLLFYYPDRAARERDQARLDTTKFVVWPRDPSSRGDRTLIASENLLALLESSSSTQRERIHNALTAGPPQGR